MAICNKTGNVAIYNEYKNLFFSPFSDGPLNFHTNPDGTMNVKNISRFGRSFSILRIPYALKLLIQELQVMNVQMRIITDDNIDQLMSMSFSNNIQKLLKTDNNNLEEVINEFVNNTNRKLQKQVKSVVEEIPKDNLELPGYEVEQMNQSQSSSSSVPFAPGSPAYVPTASELGEVDSDGYDPFADTDSVPFAPGSSPAYVPTQAELGVVDSGGYDPFAKTNSGSSEYDFLKGGSSSTLNSFFETLPENRKQQILSLPNPQDQKMVLQNIYNSLNNNSSSTASNTGEKITRFKDQEEIITNPKTSILQVEELKPDISNESESKSESNDTNSNSGSNNSSETRKIIL